MESRSLAREVALLVLGQINEDNIQNYQSISLDQMLDLALDTLLNHWREQLDYCAEQIEVAQDELSKSDLDKLNIKNIDNARDHLISCVHKSENIINILSDSFELSKLLALGDRADVREDALQRINLVITQLNIINSSLDNVMEGWRLKRLPRIDQDILRLAYVDLFDLKTPIPVTCNEAVNLANRYSDEQGRKMINGILRRLQK